MRSVNGRLDVIERLVRQKRNRAHGWQTAVSFDSGPIYLTPTPDQLNYRSYLREADCIADGLEVITKAEAEDMNLIVLNYVSDWRGA